MFTTKRKLKAEREQLLFQLTTKDAHNQELRKVVNDLTVQLEHMLNMFPFVLDQIVYEVQLKSSKGRYTKTKASKEHSLINEVVVTKDNYFKLVEKYNAQQVFIKQLHAEQYLDSVCIE